MKRKYLVWAAFAVVAFLLYGWWKRRGHVLDASNDQSLSDLFDQQNPTVAGTQPTSGQLAQATATGMPINYIPVGGKYGSLGPPVNDPNGPFYSGGGGITVDHYPVPVTVLT
jgi:hypothetical protein